MISRSFQGGLCVELMAIAPSRIEFKVFFLLFVFAFSTHPALSGTANVHAFEDPESVFVGGDLLLLSNAAYV